MMKQDNNFDTNIRPNQTPDFESIKQVSPYQAEYWSARELAPLLGYTKWENFEIAIKRAMTATEQVGAKVSDHFPDVRKMVTLGSGAQREVKDYVLSRLACYLIAQNGDSRKPEIAEAQLYFAMAARENELQQLYKEHNRRLELRERVSENNKNLAEAAYKAGVLNKSFGIFQSAGYEGLYGGLGLENIKARKGVNTKEDILDRMGPEELAANDFRITQTSAKLERESIIGQSKAIETHRQVGMTVRQAIDQLGGIMPENLAAQPSLKPALDERKRNRKKLAANLKQQQGSNTQVSQNGKSDDKSNEEQSTLW